MLIVNADFTSGEFYQTTISGLCENTTYEFSSWMINVSPSFNCGGNPIPINVKFEIWDNTNTNILASADTGNINASSGPNWGQYALVFKSLPNQTSVILKMLNNGVGGCGNDLALDDIVFKSCGDNVIIEDAADNGIVLLCEDEFPYQATLTATPDNSIFDDHFYQWQESSDNMNWTDIFGETNNTFEMTPINITRYYRVKVAEAAINVNNDSCNSLSEIYEVQAISLPASPMSNGDLELCENDVTPLSVRVPSGVTVNWYDAAVGGNLLLDNSTTYKPETMGTYYAEAETTQASCLSISRTAVKMDYLELPGVEDETLTFCENTSTTLRVNPENPEVVTSYLWSTGEVTETIERSVSGIYTVEVANNSCVAIKTIVLTQIDNPIIAQIVSDGEDIVVSTSNSGNFEYALDGNIFQLSNRFVNVDGGLYRIDVKEQDCSEIISTEYLHFYIPKFFTPNNDGENDTFNLSGIEYYASSYVSIFDRYGKLLKNSRNTPFSWDGSFNGASLPSSDYWYVIIIDNQKFTGHVTLKR
jgi:gliding motility-associated-like protein